MARLNTSVIELSAIDCSVSKVPFFNGKNPHFIAHMVQNLKPETYAPGDVVTREVIANMPIPPLLSLRHTLAAVTASCDSVGESSAAYYGLAMLTGRAGDMHVLRRAGMAQCLPSSIRRNSAGFADHARKIEGTVRPFDGAGRGLAMAP